MLGAVGTAGILVDNGDVNAHPTHVLETALLEETLDELVEMVLTHPEPDLYRAAALDGSVTFRRVEADGGTWSYIVEATEGRDPLADQATDRFLGHDHERARRFPVRTDNSYPYAFDSIAQLFDAPHAPDLITLHTAAHHVDAHHGQHGSLGVVQARAPFLAAGAGVRNLGQVHRSTRTVNVAPTIAALLQLDPHPDSVGPTGARRPGGLLRRQDGEVESELLTGERADHVVVFLLDGCNANLLAEVIDAGEAPNLASLAARGTHYLEGCMASLPTATLANHTTAVTGAHPGHTGVLHNTWYDRERDVTPDLLVLDQMLRSMDHLDPGVETLWEAVHRSRPGSLTTATFEFCDRGADFSSFALLRDGATPPFPRSAEMRHLSRHEAEADPKYAFMSKVDHTSMTHTVEAWEQRHGNPLPTLSWCALAITDEAGHASGPHGSAARAAVRDSDGRIGEVLAAVERAGVLERTAVVVIADHGMEQTNPEVDGTWSHALAATGIPHVEVDNFVYLRTA